MQTQIITIPKQDPTVNLILGDAGTGKTTSLYNLDPSITYLVATVSKLLPFKNKYKKGKNLYVSDNYHEIKQCMIHVNNNMPHIQTLVIDDSQYVMAFEFMKRANEKGYDKFTDIGQHYFSLIEYANTCRPSLDIFFITHSEMKEDGRIRAKTLGKMLDDKVKLDGLFTLILHARIIENQYVFMTQDDGIHLARSPIGMFDKTIIPNDLQLVREKLLAYCTTEEDIK